MQSQVGSSQHALNSRATQNFHLVDVPNKPQLVEIRLGDGLEMRKQRKPRSAFTKCECETDSEERWQNDVAVPSRIPLAAFHTYLLFAENERRDLCCKSQSPTSHPPS